eukprot:6047639-Prymnesium_polylepis.1
MVQSKQKAKSSPGWRSSSQENPKIFSGSCIRTPSKTTVVQPHALRSSSSGSSPRTAHGCSAWLRLERIDLANDLASD